MNQDTPTIPVFPHYGEKIKAARGLSRLLLRLLPARTLAELLFEVRVMRTRLLSICRRGRYRLWRDRPLNIGCGPKGKPNWINLDCLPDHGVNCLWDARWSLPFEGESIPMIYSEHFLEHLEYTAEAPRFLSECLRVLTKGGRIRIVVPDAGRYLLAYARGGWEALDGLRGTNTGHVDPGFHHPYTSPMQLINAVFRQGVEHQYAYDGETLRNLLDRCGFVRVEEGTPGVSALPGLAIDDPRRFNESLYMEAVKP